MIFRRKELRVLQRAESLGYGKRGERERERVRERKREGGRNGKRELT